MVENGEEYVLQWDAHAKYVTERFSGLFARQALVDVTLICDEQKLRVHKLVLASCSLYFEEMLQQDLGQEPVIFLDLNFEILKAMVEFMYCGETTIAQQSLPSLLEAAENFKVKELACMVEKTIRPQDDTLECRYFNEQELSEEEMCAMGCMTRILKDEMRINLNNSENNNNHSTLDVKDIDDSSLEKDVCLDNDNDSNQELDDDTLYESSNINNRENIEFMKIISNEEQGTTVENDVSNNNNNHLIFTDEIMKYDSKHSNSPQRDSDKLEMFEENCKVDDNLVSMSYEQCCDILSNECGDFANNRVGQCLRVYTHKRRENIVKTDVCTNRNQGLVSETSSPLCIDLLDESLTNDPPITLQSSLDTDCLKNYMSHLNDVTISPALTTIEDIICSDDDDFGQLKNNENNYNSNSNPSTSLKDTYEDDARFERSSLRRSVRLSQQDSEYSTFKRSVTKRKNNKDMEYRVPDLNYNGSNQAKRNCRRQSQNKTKRKDEKFSKLNDNAAENTSNCSIASAKYVLTATSIDRALWGDMSDVTDLDEQENMLECYEEDAQIPFAVGLLPLRAALERMQAMPEHQPRKTRSSVAPSKQESICSKRRYVFHKMDLKEPMHKKQADINAPEENANAVCHIQISTASQYRNRKSSLQDNIDSLETTSVTEKH